MQNISYSILYETEVLGLTLILAVRGEVAVLPPGELWGGNRVSRDNHPSSTQNKQTSFLIQFRDKMVDDACTSGAEIIKSYKNQKY